MEGLSVCFFLCVEIIKKILQKIVAYTFDEYGVFDSSTNIFWFYFIFSNFFFGVAVKGLFFANSGYIWPKMTKFSCKNQQFLEIVMFDE